MSDAFNHAQETLELAVVGYYWQMNTQLTRQSKQAMVIRVVNSTMERLKD